MDGTTPVPWTPAEVRILALAWHHLGAMAECEKCRLIGAVLGRTAGAVADKARYEKVRAGVLPEAVREILAPDPPEDDPEEGWEVEYADCRAVLKLLAHEGKLLGLSNDQRVTVRMADRDVVVLVCLV